MGEETSHRLLGGSRSRKQLVSKAAGLVCTGGIVRVISVFINTRKVLLLRGGGGGADGVPALCCGSPPALSRERAGLTQAQYNMKPTVVSICGV